MALDGAPPMAPTPPGGPPMPGDDPGGGSSFGQTQPPGQQVAGMGMGPSPQQELLRRWSDLTRTPNIAKEIKEEWENGDSKLTEIGMRVVTEFDVDQNSRSQWLEDSRAAMDLAMQVTKNKTSPWPGASAVVYPLVTIGAIEFAARAYPAIVASRNVVRGVVDGKDDGIVKQDPATGAPLMQPDGKTPQWTIPPGTKRERADNIAEHMSYQLLEEMDEWEEQTDKLLHILPIVGCVFRKTYFDPSAGRNTSLMVAAENVVINFWAKSMGTAPRVTEILKVYPIELEEKQRSGEWLTEVYPPPMSSNGDDRDAPHEFLEQHRRIDLDGDGYAEPYIVTVHKDTSKVARITARYDPDGIKFSKIDNKVGRIEPVEYYTKFDFLPNPKGGIYGVGFGQVLRPLNESVNTVLNQLLDAGAKQNNGGGFIGRGLSMHSGSVKFKLGEWKVVNSPGATIRDAVVPMVNAEPSAVLFQLLGLLIKAGQDVSATKDILGGQTSAATMSPTTLLALIEQGLKVFTGIYKRVHRSLKSEYEKLYRLNRIFLEDEESFTVGDVFKTIRREDYMRGTGVTPWSDPSMVSDMQKIGRAGILQQFITDPLFDGIEIRKRILIAADIEGADQLLHPDPLTNPMLFFKRKEMEIKEIQTKAQALYHMARGILALALGDKAVGDQHLDWLDAHLRMMEVEMETNLSDFSNPAEAQKPSALDSPPPVPATGDPPNVGGKSTAAAGGMSGMGGN